MRRSPLLPLVALVAVLALAAGCSSDGDDGNADADATTTTTVPEREPGAPASEASPDEIRSWLPDDEALGGDYTRLTAEEEAAAAEQAAADSGIQATFQEACPALAQIGLGSSEENPDEITAAYVAEDRREIEVSFDPTPAAFAADDVAPLVDAINDCGEVTLDNGGVSMTMTMAAEEIDDHGDHGMAIRMATEFDYLGAPMTVDFNGLAFSIEGLAVKLTATSGLGADDEGAAVAVPADTELLAELADQLEEQITS